MLRHSRLQDRENCGENIFKHAGRDGNEVLVSDIATKTWYEQIKAYDFRGATLQDEAAYFT